MNTSQKLALWLGASSQIETGEKVVQTAHAPPIFHVTFQASQETLDMLLDLIIDFCTDQHKLPYAMTGIISYAISKEWDETIGKRLTPLASSPRNELGHVADQDHLFRDCAEDTKDDAPE